MRRLPLVLLAACTSTSGSPSAGTSSVEEYSLPWRSPPQLDVLVVLDDTTAMAAYPDVAPLVARTLAEQLDDPHDAQPDARVFVTTSAGDGSLIHPATTPTAQPYIALGYDEHYNRVANTPESRAGALAELLAVPPVRSGDDQPLEAARRALDEHAESFREDAYLTIVTVAAAEDASPAAVADYVAALDGYFSAEQRRGFAFGIYAAPAPRLDAFQASFPMRNAAAPIEDEAAISEVLRPSRHILSDLVGPPCIPEPAGPPYDCAFTATYDDGTSESLPMCDAGFEGRCVDLRDDPLYCSLPGYKRVYLHGFVNRYTPPIRGQCVI